MKSNQLGLVAALCVAPILAFSQGSLTPSGAPAPTMKTLQQVEPRTPIGSLPFNITNSGSYYLTSDLAGVVGTNGINILADDVTLDLSGFALKGVVGSSNGISATGKRIAVVNGTIRGWGGAGVNGGAAQFSRFEQLRVGASGAGIFVGTGSLVRACVLAENGSDSIRVSASAFVTENVVSAGAGTGGAAIRTTGNNNRIDGNQAIDNAGSGFKIEGTNNLVVRNNARGNQNNYLILPGNDFGQILSPGSNFTNAVPWANFGSGGSGVCGNGTIEAGETCDDGNNVNGDGCTSTCAIQAGYMCSGSPSVCTFTCGDGVVAGTETCDDGNNNNGDGCSATCSVEPGYNCFGSPSVCASVCGDGVVGGGEACDDGNATSGDGCSATCSIEPGFNCAGSPSICFSVCGDGVKSVSEGCDDGNTNNGDGCSATCTVESGFFCTGSPSVCATVCGDGFKTFNEACDDGNVTNGDGCSATCSVEANYSCAGSPSVCTPYPSLTVSKAGTGSGSVSSTPSGISCGADCSESYSPGTQVTLSAAASSGSTFTGWSGACSGTGSCITTLNSAQSVTATFTLNTYTLTVSKNGVGSGTVSSSPAGITCGGDCSEAYSSGTVVTLTATPGGGSSFAGWSGGGCSGTGSCMTTINAATTVTATFNSP